MLVSLLVALPATIWVHASGTTPARHGDGLCCDDDGRAVTTDRSRADVPEGPTSDGQLRPPGSALVYQIGLDARHGYDADAIFATGIDHSTLRSVITALGVTLVNVSRFEPADLDGLSALLLNQPYVVNGDGFSPAEIAAIQAFVATGGSLMVHGDGGSGSDPRAGNLNSVVAPYGVTYADSPTDGSGWTITAFVPHPITEGIGSFGTDYQRRLTTIVAPAIDLTVGSGADDALAAVDSSAGSGCVVMVSDAGCWKNGGTGADRDITFGDNQALVESIINHFMSPACSPDCEATAVVVGTAIICEGEEVALSAADSTLSGCPGVMEYRWLRDGSELFPFPGPDNILDTPSATASYRVEVRCSDAPDCKAGENHTVEVAPDLPPPVMANVLKGVKESDGIHFVWAAPPSFTTNLRRHEARFFDHAGAELLDSLSGSDVFVAGELARPPSTVSYQIFAVNCAGTEGL